MKKIIIVFLLLLVVECRNNNKDNQFIKELYNDINLTINVLSEKLDEIKNMYIDDNPITVGLYYNGKLVKTFNKKYHDKEDIGVFNIVFTQKENIGNGNYKKIWNKYYNQYTNIDKYKIGFFLEFEADGKKQENLILDPSSKYKSGPYIFNYLYDDIHQKDGAWYSHVETKDVKSNTVYSSIKLYMSTKTNKITSPIKLTVFTYDDNDDFDSDNHYRGKSKYTITIYNK